MSSSIVLDRGQILSIVESKEKFSTDFDTVWRATGHSRKNDALRLLKNNFSEGEDFCAEVRKNPNRGRPSVSYLVTSTCFKKFAMLSKTEQGNTIREYFIWSEEQLRKQAASPLHETSNEALTGELLRRVAAGELSLVPTETVQGYEDVVEIDALDPTDSYICVAEYAISLGFTYEQVRLTNRGLGKVIAKSYEREFNCRPASDVEFVEGMEKATEVYVYDVDWLKGKNVIGYMNSRGFCVAVELEGGI